MLRRYFHSERGSIPLYMLLMMTFMYVAVFSFDYTRALAVNARLKTAVQSAALAGAATAQAVPVFDLTEQPGNPPTITWNEVAVHAVINKQVADQAAQNNFSQNVNGTTQPPGYPQFRGLNAVVVPSPLLSGQSLPTLQPGQPAPSGQASWGSAVYTGTENPYSINNTKGDWDTQEGGAPAVIAPGQQVGNVDDSYWFAVNVLISPVFLNGPLMQYLNPYLTTGPNGKKYIQASYGSSAQAYASIPGQTGP